MIRRVLKRIINNDLIVFVIYFVSIFSLCTSFLLNEFSKAIYKDINTSIKPYVTLNSPLTISSRDEYLSLSTLKQSNCILNKNNYKECKDNYYKDITNINDYVQVDYFDIQMLTGSSIYLLPFVNDNEFLYQSSKDYDVSNSDDYSELESELTYLKIRIQDIINNKAISSHSYSMNLLASISKEEYGDLYYKYNNNLIQGRYLTQEEIDNGEYKIVLYGNGYSYENGIIKKIEIGDRIKYAFFIEEGDSKVIESTYEFEVVGIINNLKYLTINNDSYDAINVNIVPEKCLTKIIEDYNETISSTSKDSDEYDDILYLPSIITLSGLDEIYDFIDYYNYLKGELKREYTYQTNIEKYLNLVSDIGTLKDTFEIIYAISLINGFLMIFLSTYFSVIKKAKEIGIYYSLGSSKTNIIKELILEYGFQIVISFLISFFVLYISMPLVYEQFANINSINEIYNFKELLEVKTLSFLKILLVIIISFIPSILSSVLYISHFNPKEVLKDEQ